MKKRFLFFQEFFFKDFSLSSLNLNYAKLILSDESRFSSVLNFNAGHSRDKKVILKASNLDVRRTKSQLFEWPDGRIRAHYMSPQYTLRVKELTDCSFL